MKKVLKKILFLLIIILSISQGRLIYAQEVAEELSIKQPYSILLVGHAYGYPMLQESIEPAKNLVDSWETLLQHDPDFVVFLGDITRNSTIEELEIFSDSLLLPLEVPYYNTPGNHDLEDSEDYQQLFPEAYQSQTVGSDLHLFLNTGLSGDLGQEQSSWLTEQLEFATNSEEVQRIFIYSHRLYWLAQLSEDISYFNNERATSEDDAATSEFIFTLLDATEKPIYLFSGDIGAHSPPNSLKVHISDQVTAYATGVGDIPTDSVMVASVSAEQVVVNKISLRTPDVKEKIHGLEVNGSQESTYDSTLKFLNNVFYTGNFIIGLIVGTVLATGVLTISRRFAQK